MDKNHHFDDDDDGGDDDDNDVDVISNHPFYLEGIYHLNLYYY